MTPLADVVSASRDVTGTSSRSRKVAILAELLRALEPSEVPICVGFLSGVPRQGRVGVGYSTIRGIDQPPAGEASLTVADVDRAVSEMEAATGSGAATRRRELLGELLGRATQPEAEFLTALLTGGLRQGALAGLMADAVAKAADVPGELARRALMLSGELSHMAEIAMTSGEEGLRELALRSSGQSCQCWRLPARVSPRRSPASSAPRWSSSSTASASRSTGFEDEVRVYTRNLNEITASLPGIVDAVLRLPVTRAVLDGEALWMDGRGPAPFQYTVSQIDSGAPPQGIVTFLFDLLHIDGDDLLDTPLEERLRRLEAIAAEHKVPSVLTSDAEAGQRVLDESLRAGHEGVVVKDAASSYAAGRRGRAWRKVKPVRTYDLVVLAAEWGHGRRQGWLSNLHLGARDPGSGTFVMVGKTFKGLTDELLRWQTTELLARQTSQRGITGVRASRAGRRDSAGRRPIVHALPGRHRASFRPRQALPP